MNIFTKILISCAFFWGVLQIYHMHDDITAIQVKLNMLDEKGRLLPEYKSALQEMRNHLAGGTPCP